MDVLGMMAFTFALPALALAFKNRERINNLETKLKDFDVLPKEFDSEKQNKEAPHENP